MLLALLPRFLLLLGANARLSTLACRALYAAAAAANLPHTSAVVHCVAAMLQLCCSYVAAILQLCCSYVAAAVATASAWHPAVAAAAASAATV